MSNAPYRHIIEAVIRRVAVKLGASGDKGRLITVFTGAGADFNGAVDQIRRIVLDGYRIETVFSDAAENLYGDALREMLGGFPYVSALDETQWLKATDTATAVVVPLLSLNTLSRISLLMADSVPTNIILRALFTGRPVLAAQNGVLPGSGFWKGKPGVSQPPALRSAVLERLSTLKGYGCQVIDTDALRNTVTALDKGKTKTEPAVKPNTRDATTQRRTIRPTSRSVTTAQVRRAHAAGADLLLPEGTVITPLAREMAMSHRVALLFETTDEG